MEKEKRIPELRFPEFKDEWKEKRLDELIKISSKRYNPKETNEFNKSIELENIEQNSGSLIGMSKINEKSSMKNLFEKDNILFGKLRPYLKKFYKTNNRGVCSSEIWVIKPKKELDINYTYNLIQTDSFMKAAEITTGTKMPRADWSYMKKKKLAYPSLQEQQKIGYLFNNLDQKIDLQNKKIENLKDYKKGMMQRIFSQEIRFKDENGNEYPEWIKERVEKIFKSIPIGEYQILVSQILEKGKYPVITQSQEGIVGYSNDESKVFKDIPIISFGDHTTILNYINKEFVIGGDSVKLLKEIKGYNKKYLFYNLQYRNVPQDGYKRHFSILRELSLDIPHLEEQEKIANFLSSIDKKIELEEDKLSSYEEFKKGLMQRMFI